MIFWISGMDRISPRGSNRRVTKLSAKVRRWQWASINPGKTVLPLQSMIFVFAFLNSFGALIHCDGKDLPVLDGYHPSFRKVWIQCEYIGVIKDKLCHHLTPNKRSPGSFTLSSSRSQLRHKGQGYIQFPGTGFRLSLEKRKKQFRITVRRVRGLRPQGDRGHFYRRDLEGRDSQQGEYTGREFRRIRS